MVEKFIRVTVTDSEGKTYTAVTTSPVANDATSDVSIIDVMGLQSDGTAVVGDRLRISYGSTFGTPTAATWYKDGAVLTTASVGDGVANMINLDITPARGAGTYKATVVADGKTYTTNEIVVTNKEEQAVITEFTIEDDYTDGTDITYGALDRTAVATVTLSKNYGGNIQIWKKSDSKYSAAIDNLVTNQNTVANWITSTAIRNNTASVNPAVAAPADGASVLASDQPTNYTIENITNGSGIGHINADGTVTYKWVVGSAAVATVGLTRGTEYVVTFDQSSITTDTPGTGTANVFATAVAAPYVTAPAKIAVTKISNGNAPEITFQDADGNTLQWLGKPARAGVAATALARNATNTLALAAFDSAAVYANTVKANDPTASTVTALDAGAAATQIGTQNALASGVWTGGANAGNTAYWFAKVTAPGGVYGASALTLTSDAVDVAQDAATMMNLVEDKDTATSAVVSFSNLRCDGKVYIVRGASYGANNTDYISTAENIYKGYNAVGGELVTASADVAKGAEKVTVPGAIGKYTGVIAAGATGQTVNGDNYIAVFIPNDEANYGRIYTDNYSETAGAVTGFNSNDTILGTTTTPAGQNDDSCGVQITQKATSLKYDAAGADTVTNDGVNKLTIKSTKVIAYDQFGEKVTTTKALADVTSVTATDNTITNAERGAAKFAVNDAGEDTGVTTIELTMAAGGAGTGVDDKDGFTVKVLGSDFTVFNKSGGLLALTAAVGWEIKLGTNTLLAAPSAAAATELAALNALTFTADSTGAKPTVTVDGTVGTVTATSATEANGTVAVNARVATMTYVADGTSVITITVTGDTYKRVTTWTYTGDTNDANSTVSAGAVTDVVSPK